MTTAAKTTLPPDGRHVPTHHTYDWPAHAATLRTRTDEWVMLEAEFSIGMLHYLRTGQQPDLATFGRELELQVRGSAPTPTGGRRGELWGRYTPGRERPTRGLSDEQVRTIREQYAAGGVSTTMLAAQYGTSQSMVSYLVTGQRRAAAGGPITPARTRTAG